MANAPIADVGRPDEDHAMFKHWLKKRPSHDLGSEWPPLPTNGFLLNRAATAADIDQGDAIFSQTSNDGLEAKPWPVVLPQYALWQDEDGSIRRVFVVQAETHISDPAGEPIYGLLSFDGEEIVASGQELQLLGTAPPAT